MANFRFSAKHLPVTSEYQNLVHLPCNFSNKEVSKQANNLHSAEIDNKSTAH